MYIFYRLFGKKAQRAPVEGAFWYNKNMNEELLARARKIKIVLNDVDGIWTDGTLHFFLTPDGRVEEIKSFNAQDGIAVMMLRSGGIKSGIITGRRHETTLSRARNLGMNYYYQGFLTKLGPLEDILKRENITADEVAYMGDDLTDLPLLEKVGLAVTVPNALAVVKESAHFVTSRVGGDGAYREMVDLIISAQGKMDAMLCDIRAGRWTRPAAGELQIVTSEEGIS